MTYREQMQMRGDTIPPSHMPEALEEIRGLREIINSIEQRLEEGHTAEQILDWLEGLRAEKKL